MANLNGMHRNDEDGTNITHQKWGTVILVMGRNLRDAGSLVAESTVVRN